MHLGAGVEVEGVLGGAGAGRRRPGGGSPVYYRSLGFLRRLYNTRLRGPYTHLATLHLLSRLALGLCSPNRPFVFLSPPPLPPIPIPLPLTLPPLIHSLPNWHPILQARLASPPNKRPLRRPALPAVHRTQVPIATLHHTAGLPPAVPPQMDAPAPAPLLLTLPPAAASQAAHRAPRLAHHGGPAMSIPPPRLHIHAEAGALDRTLLCGVVNRPRSALAPVLL